MITASLILGFSFLFPLWSISLNAPQYPEGLGIYIYVYKLEGHKDNDLNSINGLNHYIGMKIIDKDAIPELKIIPFFMIFMMIFGLIIAFVKNYKFKLVWLGIFFLGGIIGMVDFYQWEYDYGHNLSPTAIIKIPGMSYQPPLIGTEQLLNFEAGSFPHIAFFIILISILLVIFSTYYEKKHEKII